MSESQLKAVLQELMDEFEVIWYALHKAKGLSPRSVVFNKPYDNAKSTLNGHKIPTTYDSGRKDIYSAPKDGTWILVSNGDFICIARWDEVYGWCDDSRGGESINELGIKWWWELPPLPKTEK